MHGAKGIRSPIVKQTSHPSDGKLGRILVDLSGEREFPGLEGKRYTTIARDENSRYVCVYVLRRTSDATSALEIIRSDGGTKFLGPFEHCLEVSNSERANSCSFSAIQRLRGNNIAMIQSASHPARIQAKHISYKSHLPDKLITSEMRASTEPVMR